jgi:hypothetical protein
MNAVASILNKVRVGNPNERFRLISISPVPSNLDVADIVYAGSVFAKVAVM